MSDNDADHVEPAWVPGIHSGQMRPRWDRLAKNARWYLIRRDGIAKIGWGDLAADDLDAIAEHIGGREAVVVLPEVPRKGQHLPHSTGEQLPGWCWYDRPDCHPVTAAVLAESARFVVVNHTVHVVYDDADRDHMWVRIGRTGGDGEVPGVIAREYRRIVVRELIDRLHDLAGTSDNQVE